MCINKSLAMAIAPKQPTKMSTASRNEILQPKSAPNTIPSGPVIHEPMPYTQNVHTCPNSVPMRQPMGAMRIVDRIFQNITII